MYTPTALTNKDIPAVRKYISAEKEMNLFIEGDIEQYGLETETVTLYAFGKDWDCLLLKYYSNFMITSTKETYDARQVAEFLKGQNMQCLSADELLLKQIQPYFPFAEIHGTFLCRLERESFQKLPAQAISVSKLTREHAQMVVDLYKQIEEFARPYIEKEAEKLEETRSNFDNGGNGYGIFKNGMLVATAYTTASTKDGAMIVGVATHPSWRNQGLASTVMNELCTNEFAQGRSFLCLFYSSPTAGALYHRLGFETIGRWGMLKF
ncbi:MAG: GNAT family N-acetyltransferase [Sphaerochaetaceae bacterium]